jgi:hypothetical protein
MLDAAKEAMEFAAGRTEKNFEKELKELTWKASL